MDYKITCVCGHSFLLSEDKVRGEVNCPACGQRLNPAIEAPVKRAGAEAGDAAGAASAPSAGAGAEPTKRCPFCGEVILAMARKCKHCGEFLDRAAPAGAGGGSAAGTAAGVAPAAATDEPAFSLTISQWDNFWKYLTLASAVAFIIFVLSFFRSLHPYLIIGVPTALVIGGIIGWGFYLSAKGTRVIIRPLRLDIERGLLRKRITSLELFRVTDITLDQGLIPRLLGFGTIKLTTTDTDSPELVLYHIPRAREARKYLQTQVPLAARQRGAFYMEK